MGLSKDAFVRGHTFDGTTGLHTGEQLEDLVTRASPADGSEIVDQETLETYLDDILSIYRIRVKDGSITEDKIADGAITNAKLAEGFTMVKSIQRSTTAVLVEGGATANVTITAVDLSKSMLLINQSVDNDYGPILKARLSSTTNIELINTASGHRAWADWQVIEFI